MKKLTLTIIARFRRQQRVIHRQDAHRRLSKIRKSRHRYKRQLCSETRKAIRLHAPSTFNIEQEDDRLHLVYFLSKLREPFASDYRGTILIDFSRTKRFIASGTLLFYAELNRLIAFGKGRIQVKCTEPENLLASQVLNQIGLYDLCQHPNQVRSTHRDVVHWRVAHGWQIDAERYAHAIEAHEGKLAEPLLNGVFRGLAEATANAVEHAYEDIRDDNLNYAAETKDWWLFSQAKDGQLFVAICDLGIGIPRSLPTKRSTLFERLMQTLGFTPSDGHCIQAAVEDSRTRTGKAERGKGLGNIIDAVSRSPDGTAFVFSNYGCYSFNKGKETIGNFRTSILGTLIMWRLSLRPSPTNDK